MSGLAESELDGDWIDFIAGYLGASGPALRLLVSLLLVYPIIFTHRLFLYNKPSIIQHIYFIVFGSYIGYFNYGGAIAHAYVCIIVQYIFLLFTSGTLISVLFSFTFQMSYLMILYFMTETNTYDIKWTIPHCVLTLRLIGQAYDVFDGMRNEKELSEEQKKSAVKKFPSIMESAGHVLFPASFMIGPQYPMNRYLKFVNGDYTENGQPPNSVTPGLQRLMYGLIYVGIFQIGSLYINSDYVMSENFKNLYFFQKMLIVGIFGRIMLYKYVSCWIVTEGACILSGITHNGISLKGETKWDGCENIDIALFEKSYKFGHLILAFNKCTNKWVAEYIYKRLKFLGNRFISQGMALLFLAVWHGLHSGYYMCFFMEFLVMNAEKKLERVFVENKYCMMWHNSTIGRIVDAIIFKVLLTCFFGYCLVPFVLLKFNRWFDIYSQLYFCGTILFAGFGLLEPMARTFLKSSKKGAKKERQENGVKVD